MSWLLRRPIFCPIRSRLMVTGLSAITCDVSRNAFSGLGSSARTTFRADRTPGGCWRDWRVGPPPRFVVSAHGGDRVSGWVNRRRADQTTSTADSPSTADSITTIASRQQRLITRNRRFVRRSKAEGRITLGHD